MSLYKKIYDVMTETESIEKGMTVGEGRNSYKAVSEKDMLNMVKPLLKKHGLVFIPIDGEIAENVMTYETYDNYSKSNVTKMRAVTTLKAKWRLADIESGESIDVVGFGNGADPQDKGAGKAFTYAYKAMLAKTFMIFSGEDTDNTHSDDIPKQSIYSKPTTKKAQGGWRMSDAQEYALIDLILSTGADMDKLAGYFDVTELEYLNEEQYKEALSILEKKVKK